MDKGTLGKGNGGNKLKQHPAGSGPGMGWTWELKSVHDHSAVVFVELHVSRRATPHYSCPDP
jgi:hypothetical protein